MEEIDIDAVTAPAFCLADDLTPMEIDWHQHTKHQILFATSGTMWLEADGNQWLLAGRRAALIKSGTPHRVDIRTPVALRTIYLDDSIDSFSTCRECQVFPVDDLAFHLFSYAPRWGVGVPLDRTGLAYFQAIARLCQDWSKRMASFSLPVGKSAPVRRAITLMMDNLHRPISGTELAKHTRLSSRTLARHFKKETGLNWSEFLRFARMFRAAEMLTETDKRVSDVCNSIGFGSISAFCRAFDAFFGESPRAYRKRRTQSRYGCIE